MQSRSLYDNERGELRDLTGGYDINKMIRLSVFAVLVHCVLLGAAVGETKDDDADTALRIELVEDVAHSI